LSCKFGCRGQILILFAVLYVALMYQLVYFTPYYGIGIDVSSNYIQALNLMFKRSVCDALAFHVNGGEFIDRLNLDLHDIMTVYPLIVELSSYNVILKDGYVGASATLQVYDFKYRCKYTFSYNCCLGFKIVNITVSNSYVPAFNDIKMVVGVFGDSEVLLKPPVFTISYNYNGSTFTFNPYYESLMDGYYMVHFVIPLNVHAFTFIVIDWRGVKCIELFKL
jgi:hypothetical protein